MNVTDGQEAPSGVLDPAAGQIVGGCHL